MKNKVKSLYYFDMEAITLLRNLNIIYLEDEDNIRENITSMLNYLFKNVYAVENVQQALTQYENAHVDIILSDISMPGQNGLDFVKKIREENSKIPIIMLTAHTDTHYLLDATKLKLIDYLTKPIDFDTLQSALIKAAKECETSQQNLIHFDSGIQYNIDTKEILCNDKLEAVTQKESLLIEFLYQNKNKVVTKEELFEYIWDDYFKATDSALKSLLNKLRKKIGKNSIKNISGVGYQINTQ